MVRRVGVPIALALAGLVGMAVPAYAGNWSDNESTTGASASCTMRSWTAEIHDQNADISCDISDTLGDSHSVYVDWWQDGYAKKRLTNHDGAGHTTHSYDSRYNPDGSFGTLYWRVCRDVQLGDDNCSRTISHRTS